jgi:lysozyme family protein
MKENFKKALLLVLKDEGKFSDIPEDKGGPTNQGVTLKTLIDFHKNFDYGDMDNDGDIDINDIKLLDEPEEAAPIYKKWFWDVIKGDELPDKVDYVVFDSAVNHGPKVACIFLQKASNRLGSKLTVDGRVGPYTIKKILAQDPMNLVVEILRERDIFYRKIVANDSSQEKFLKGWLNRIAGIAVTVKSFV